SQTVAPSYTGHGCELDRSCLDSARGATVSGPAVAPAIGAASSTALVAKPAGRGPQRPPHAGKWEQTMCGDSGVREKFPCFTTLGLLLIGCSDLSAHRRYTTP